MTQVLSPVHQELKGGPGTAPFAVQFMDDTEPEAVHVLEGRAARRDSSRLGKWTDRNHTGSNNSRHKVLPQDKQVTGLRTVGGSCAERALGHQFLSLFGATAGPSLPCCAAGAVTRIWWGQQAMVSYATSTTRGTSLLLASCEPGAFTNNLCRGNMVGTQSCSPWPEELRGTPLE